MGAAMAQAESAYGREYVFVAADAAKRHVGIQIPSLAVSWLINNVVWPLQSVTQAGGPPKSLKSTFSFELLRWYCLMGGAGFIIDTEKKLSPTMLPGLIPAEFHHRVGVIRRDTIEEWQKEITARREQMDAHFLKNKSMPGFPVLTIVDSVTGVTDEVMAQKIEETGSAPGKGFHAGPQVISQYLKTLSLLGYPWTVHFVNHQKINPQTGQDVRPGGLALDFHGAIDLKFKVGMTKAEQALFCTTDTHVAHGVTTKNVSMVTRKNSFGPDNRKIVAPFRWKYDTTDDGEREQHAWWDWNEADARLLVALAGELKAEGLEITQTRNGTAPPRVHCPELGISKEDALPYSEFGKAVTEDPEKRNKLRKMLAIPNGNVFVAGCLDDLKQKADAEAEAGKKDKPLKGKAKKEAEKGRKGAEPGGDILGKGEDDDT